MRTDVESCLNYGVLCLKKTMRKPERLKEALKLMVENRNKYCDFVWYARANPQKLLKDEIYEGLNAMQEIERKFPQEVKDIKGDDNWTHGFNSGMLAASRLYHEMIEGNIEYALNNHPDLDS